MLWGFSKVAAHCSKAGIYKTCKCEISKLRGKEHHQKLSIIEMLLLFKKGFDFAGVPS